MIVSPQKEESKQAQRVKRDFSSPNFATSTKEILHYDEYDSKDLSGVRIINDRGDNSLPIYQPIFQRRSRSLFLMLPGHAL